jgi:hypothetical protein
MLAGRGGWVKGDVNASIETIGHRRLAVRCQFKISSTPENPPACRSSQIARIVARILAKKPLVGQLALVLSKGSIVAAGFSRGREGLIGDAPSEKGGERGTGG